MANEYTVNQADLVAVANAIRERSGVSDSLVFPNGFAEAIANIAGLPGGISALASGTITLTAQSSYLTLEHNLGVRPNFYYVRAQEKFDSAAYNGKIYTSSGSSLGGYELEHLAYYSSSGGAFSTKQVAGSFWGLENTLNTMDASGYYYKANCTYHWICGVFRIE